MFIDKNKFLELIKEYQEDKSNREAYEEISLSLLKIIRGLINKRKFYQYMDVEDLEINAYIACIEVLDKFDEKMKSKHNKGNVNPFSFFNSVAFFTMVNLLKAKDKYNDKNLLTDFYARKSGSLTLYEEMSFFNETFKEKEIENQNTKDLFIYELSNHFKSKRDIFKKEGKKFMVLYDNFIKFLEEFKPDNISHFDLYLESQKVPFNRKELKYFFMIIRENFNYERLVNMADH